MTKNIFQKTLAALLLGFGGVFASTACGGVSVELGGNAYVISGEESARITDSGAEILAGAEQSVVGVFFALERPQKNVQLSIEASGVAEYELSCAGKTLRVKVESEDSVLVPVGRVDFPTAGYQRVNIRRIADGGNGKPGKISALLLTGTDCGIAYVHDFSPLWGRRGPSVHFAYEKPRGAEIEYFYNEVCVPEGADVLHSFYMVCGFDNGYFGLQTNSPTERRVLFSVWSPFKTDDPEEVPEDARVVLSRKGEGVVAQDFGAEGTGGQSFLVYPWRAGTTYKFLVQARPNGDGSTQFTGYFFAPEEQQWKLVASFKRPKTDSWLGSPHSFLENFWPDSGWRERCVIFSNQWVRDRRGKWSELLDGTFSCDNTGKRYVRLDYAGGLSSDRKSFVLKNCGFFNGTTLSGTPFTRKTTGTPPPQIDFSALETLGS